MAGWSYMLCYFDRECRPFDGWLFGNGTAVQKTNFTNESLFDNANDTESNGTTLTVQEQL